MLSVGLLSVTFRQRTPQEIVRLAVEADLQQIEWGGDIHVPHGQLTTAKEVGTLTRDNGLTVSAYGSYYRLGESSNPPFTAVLDTAQALGTEHIRVWAGKRGSVDADASYRQEVIEDAQRVVELAHERTITISLEYHNHTLTDTYASAISLLQAVDSPHLRTFWQPPHTPDLAGKCHDLKNLLKWVTNVHVFHWHPHTYERFSLHEGADDWRQYLEILATSERDHTLSLEFVRDDDEAVFLRDAQTLKAWLG